MFDFRFIIDDGIFDICYIEYDNIFSDPCVSTDDRPRINYGIRANFHFRIDICRFRVDQCDSVLHVHRIDAFPKYFLSIRESNSVIYTERFLKIRRNVGFDTGSPAPEDGNDIRQIILILCVIVTDVFKSTKQRSVVEYESPGAYFLDFALEIRVILLLDDTLNRAVLLPDNAAVSERCMRTG